ncbi:hypothetical protein TWF106_000747 [Orbilia oligospora]|uniref:Uncharacterized protein n=1 Tax=Orbilia oligospora TaxID=2813651 RepID=A0A7C8USM6_ORBOL|nr:hypothetical protein TWF106_000747 [Orbilia oligospora]
MGDVVLPFTYVHPEYRGCEGQGDENEGQASKLVNTLRLCYGSSGFVDGFLGRYQRRGLLKYLSQFYNFFLNPLHISHGNGNSDIGDFHVGFGTVEPWRGKMVPQGAVCFCKAAVDLLERLKGIHFFVAPATFWALFRHKRLVKACISESEIVDVISDLPDILGRFQAISSDEWEDG